MKYCTIKMKPPKAIIKRLGLDATGDVQREYTKIICNRMTRYMPSESGVLSKKLKFMVAPNKIIVLGPYAHYQYKGEVWGPNIPIKENGHIVGYRSPPIKRPTGRNLVYHKRIGGNDRPGPFWDKRLIAAEGKAIEADLKRYIERKDGKRT